MKGNTLMNLNYSRRVKCCFSNDQMPSVQLTRCGICVSFPLVESRLYLIISLIEINKICIQIQLQVKRYFIKRDQK